MRKAIRGKDEPRGQVLVIVALGMISILAMVGLVIDGGYAWSRQRDTQNGADAVSLAGTGQIQQYLHDLSGTDWDVACAVDRAAAANGVQVETAEYVDANGVALTPPAVVGTCGPSDPGTAIPAGAQGVRAQASETFETFLMKIIGFSTLTTSADATSVVGTPAGSPGGALPLTFPQHLKMCDDTEAIYQIRMDTDGVWEPYEVLQDESLATPANLASIPLCDTNEGSVGWLDYGCGQNLQQAVDAPCSVFIPVPWWIHTQTGNVNALEDNLNAYAGSQPGVPEGPVFGTADTDAVLALPIHSNTCLSNPDEGNSESDPHDPVCPEGDWSGQGDNNNYEVYFWIGFKIDQAHTGGGDPECQTGDGQPLLQNPNPPGKVGCLKGWFVLYIDQGPISLGPITPGEDVSTTISLIE